MKNFLIEMDVRDNELDAQGIVNNANYMIYLSHARHKHGELLGIYHTDYALKNLNLIITSCSMKFKNSLKANERFSVSSTIISGELPLHWAHRQEIKRINDGKIILKAIFNATCVNNSLGSKEKLFIPEIIQNVIK